MTEQQPVYKYEGIIKDNPPGAGGEVRVGEGVEGGRVCQKEFRNTKCTNYGCLLKPHNEIKPLINTDNNHKCMEFPHVAAED